MGGGRGYGKEEGGRGGPEEGGGAGERVRQREEGGTKNEASK